MSTDWGDFSGFSLNATFLLRRTKSRKRNLDPRENVNYGLRQTEIAQLCISVSEKKKKAKKKRLERVQNSKIF